MLVEIRIRNFKCIKNLVVDLRYDLRAPNGYRDYTTFSFLEDIKLPSVRIVPTLAIFGPNASGKSTVLQAVRVLQVIATKRYVSDLFCPNKICEYSSELGTSDIGVTFCDKGKKFNYDVTYNGEGIVREILKIDGLVEFEVCKAQITSLSQRLKTLEKDLSRVFSNRCVKNGDQKQEKTFLWCIGQEFLGVGEDLNNAFNFFNESLVCYFSNKFSFSYALNLLASCQQGTSPEDKRQHALLKISDCLKKLDTRIESITTETTVLPNELSLRKNLEFRLSEVGTELKVLNIEVHTFHRREDGELAEFDLLNEESSGTQRLASLIGVFLYALETGKAILIDEMEASLHPLLVKNLIGLFKEKNKNKNNAQLIFTTHNTDLLDSETLKISEVALIDQRGFAGSQIIRLSNIKGVRNSNNFRKMYLRGDFGAIPFSSL